MRSQHLVEATKVMVDQWQVASRSVDSASVIASKFATKAQKMISDVLDIPRCFLCYVDSQNLHCLDMCLQDTAASESACQVRPT